MPEHNQPPDLIATLTRAAELSREAAESLVRAKNIAKTHNIPEQITMSIGAARSYLEEAYGLLEKLRD